MKPAISRVARATFDHALRAVAPAELVRSALRLEHGSTLRVAGRASKTAHSFDLKKTPNILVLGAGKASQELCHGLLSVLQEPPALALGLRINALINIPEGQKLISYKYADGVNVEFMETSHPLPNAATLDCTTRQLEAIKSAPKNTLMIALLSGGGSSLFESTYGTNIHLDDVRALNKLLLESGASITEINIVRKHISQVKGGRFASHAIKSGNVDAVVGLYLSDVVGDDLSSVASGPTCPDLSTYSQAVDIAKKYNFWEKLPTVIRDRLSAGLSDSSLETPKPGDSIFEHVCNVLVGSADTSASAAESFLQKLAETKIDNVNIFSNQLSGEAKEFGFHLIDKIAELAPKGAAKFALIGTGEFTVTLKGRGVGGRNQEMLLAFLISLIRRHNEPNFPLKDYVFSVVSCAFDGIEGNSPATGAMVDSSSVERVAGLFSEAQLMQHLENNDSHSIFAALNDALITGQTGTNVNDMLLIVVEKK